MVWQPPRIGDAPDGRSIRQAFKSLEKFLENPVFPNGIKVGTGDTGSADPATGAKVPPVTQQVRADQPWPTNPSQSHTHAPDWNAPYYELSQGVAGDTPMATNTLTASAAATVVASDPNGYITTAGFGTGFQFTQPGLYELGGLVIFRNQTTGGHRLIEIFDGTSRFIMNVSPPATDIATYMTGQRVINVSTAKTYSLRFRADVINNARVESYWARLIRTP